MNLGQRLSYYYALLFATSKLAKFHYLLLKVALKGIGVLNFYNKVVSGEEYFVSRLLPRLLQNQTPIFFDVGANQGDYSVLLVNQFPDAKIFAFEPHPKNYLALTQLDFAKLSSFELALSDVAGLITLYDHADYDGTTNATLYKDVIGDIYHKDSNTHEVMADTLDSIVNTHNINTIDFMKIDTEGNELAILRGGAGLLQQERIGAIQFEFNEMNVISHAFLYDFRRILNNYTLFRMLPRGLLPLADIPLLTELFAYQNILAVPNNSVHLLGHTKILL